MLEMSQIDYIKKMREIECSISEIAERFANNISARNKIIEMDAIPLDNLLV